MSICGRSFRHRFPGKQHEECICHRIAAVAMALLIVQPVRSAKWEQPEVVQMDRESMKATFFNFETRAKALVGDMTASRYYHSLDGSWSFGNLPTPESRPPDFYWPDPARTAPGSRFNVFALIFLMNLRILFMKYTVVCLKAITDLAGGTATQHLEAAFFFGDVCILYIEVHRQHPAPVACRIPVAGLGALFRARRVVCNT
jgi:hypothetical protein